MRAVEATVREHFDQDVATLFALVTDPDFLRRRTEAAGEKNVVVHVDRAGGGLAIRIERDVERSLPSFMKKVFAPTHHLTDQQRWDVAGPAKVSTWTVAIQGQARVQLGGTLTLAAGASGGCDYTETFTATVAIPLIGKQVAKYVLGETEATIRRQIAFARAALAT
jgi:hypothetical protein